MNRRQQKKDLILDEKATKRFMEQRETERINRFEITALVQTKVNIGIYYKKCRMNFMNKDKFNAKHYSFAKRVINNFVNQIPEISIDFISIQKEKEFIKVPIL